MGLEGWEERGEEVRVKGGGGRGGLVGGQNNMNKNLQNLQVQKTYL